MAHIRKDSSKPTTTISWTPELLNLVDDYRFSNRKDSRGEAVNELVKLGFKYIQALEKKKAKQKALV